MDGSGSESYLSLKANSSTSSSAMIHAFKSGLKQQELRWLGLSQLHLKEHRSSSEKTAW